MRLLSDVNPTEEQLVIVSRNRPGLEIIRGSAGSGKTTTALLRLKSLITMFRSRRQRTSDGRPIRALVLTYNRTLRGYVKALAETQVRLDDNVILEVSTFAKWAKNSLEKNLEQTISIIDNKLRATKINGLAKDAPLPEGYLLEEMDYLMGRFLPDNLDDYLGAERTGRGASPRVDQDVRLTLLNQVARPYQEWLSEQDQWDWNDLATAMASQRRCDPYDIIIADEAQDFSANELRAIRHHLADEHSLTFVLDTTQRIYARGYTWKECGFSVRPEQSHRLGVNFRNTRQIARFAASLLSGIDVDDDGSMPNFKSCDRNGPLPKVLIGRFGVQMDWCLNYLENQVDLKQESVAFLHPKGGGYFDEVRNRLTRKGLDYVEINRRSDWPEGPTNIGLSTMHSAKGLEFDHVIAIGLSKEMMEKNLGDDDERMHTWRKLLAMAIGRAKHSVVLGYKPGEGSRLVDYIEAGTYETIAL